jgi:putative inorganic carbon (HCO3(-)) transporter
VNAGVSIAGVGRQLASVSGQALYPVLLAVVVLMAGLALVLLPLSWIALLILSAGAGLLILLRPVVGLYLLVVAIPFGSLKEINLGVLNVGGAEIVAALTLMAWLARMLAHRRVRTVHPPLLVPLLIVLLVACFSVMGALSLQWSLKGLLVWLELLAVYLLVANLVDITDARILVILVLLAGCLEALLGLYQFFGRVGPEGFLLFDRFMRAYGTFDQPNPYGGYLALILPLALSLFLAHWRWRRPSELLTWGLAGLSVALMGAALVASWSRGAWLGFAAGAIVVAMAGLWCRAFSALRAGALGGLAGALLALLWLGTWGPGLVIAVLVGALAGTGMGLVIFLSLRRRHLWLLGAVAVVLAALLVGLGGEDLLPTAVAQRFSDLSPYVQVPDVRGVQLTDENYAVVERLAHWEAALAMLADHPLLGVGIGNYVPVYPAYAVPGWKDPLGHAHNQYLNVAAETGLVGLAAYLFLVAAWAGHAWRAVRSLSGYAQGVSLGVLGVLGSLATHSLFDNLYVHGMNMHLALLLGLLFVLTTKRGECVVQNSRVDS